MKTNLKQAEQLKHEARRDMVAARNLEIAGQPDRAVDYHIDATFKDAAAQELMACASPSPIMSGEIVLTEIERPNVQGGWALRNTLDNPDTAAIEASAARTDLLSQTHIDVLATGLDAAASAGCTNSLEKMLAHQLALAHAAAFKLVDAAMQQTNSVEMARLINASGRMMAAFQQGLTALHRIKNGGNQIVTVQHVTVNGGQTLVTGNMQAGGQPTLPRGGK